MEDEGELSSQQRARISQNFRAAKARLASKRPRQFSPHYRDGNGITALTSKASVERVPLAEICLNTHSPFSVKGSKLTDEKSNSALYNDRRFGISNPSIKAKEVAGNIDNFALESLTNPVNELGHSGLSQITMPCSVVIEDDDFDDSILKEIDALCELHSAKKAHRDDQIQCPDTSSETSLDADTAQGNVKIEGTCETCIDAPDNSSVTYKSSLDPDTVQGHVKIGGTCETSIDTQWSAQLSCLLKEVEKKSMPGDYLKYLNSLNDRQQEAACSNIAIPLMIVAGPGSGKTSTMVGRVLMLLNEGIEPSHILAMTFTTAAASEMRDRIGLIAGKAIAKELPISTFHSFSLHLCRSHAEKLGRTPEFLIYGHSQQRRAVIEALRLLENDRTIHDNELGKLSDPRLFKDKSKKWLKFVTQAKASGRNPEECLQMGDQLGAMVLRNYNEILSSCNALDYHDLISCSVKLLTDFPEVTKESEESWEAIVIDEFQDTSAMQYNLLKILASHHRITIVGDDDQSIFSFNGADVSGFDSFRKDFPNHKEVRLSKNYRSTRCIVEAASYLIGHNTKRCQLKSVLTDNSSGEKITFKECHNENAQCSFVVDKILEITSVSSAEKCGYGSIAILYRRQVSGKAFQTVFRDRKIPFNTHGVAFYKKKVVKAIIAMLRTTLPGCEDGPYRQVFKALLPLEKEEKKRMVEHIDKVSTVRKCSFLSAACDIFSAKISGTFKRSQLTQGRKVLLTLEMVSKLAHREQSISVVITSVANMIPQKYLLEQRALVDVDGGKLLNEDNDIRSVLQYLLDDVSEFISTKFIASDKGVGCVNILKAFVDYINERESENFRSRKVDNKDSVTLTTIHQSKGLEWDTVFIVKVNESEIPLIHDYNGAARENGSSLEEERRLFYVGMTRARKKLFILYVTMDSNWQMLQPSRFLKEIPDHLRETQADLREKEIPIKNQDHKKDAFLPQSTLAKPCGNQFSEVEELPDNPLNIQTEKDSMESLEECQEWNGNNFTRRFSVEDRAVVSHIFHQWAKKKAFQDPKRLLDKVGFVIDERLAAKKSKHKDVLLALKTCLRCEEAILYAEHIANVGLNKRKQVVDVLQFGENVLRWEQIPADKRAHLMREKQEHFQKLRIENAMSSSEPTAKQITFLRSLGCTIVPTSRLHASNLIEQYKSL